MAEIEDTELMLAELFDRYADGYDDYDVSAIIQCFAFPCVIWQFDKGHIFADADELVENLDALLDVHRENGVIQSVYEVVSTHVSGSTASISMDWQQEDEDGEVIFDFTCHYNLLNQEGEWKIISIINESD